MKGDKKGMLPPPLLTPTPPGQVEGGGKPSKIFALNVIFLTPTHPPMRA